MGSIMKNGQSAEAAVQALVETLEGVEKQAGVRALAAEALGWISGGARSAVPALRRARSAVGAELREAAAKALERIEKDSPG